jgi:group I intron endonuclease
MSFSIPIILFSNYQDSSCKDEKFSFKNEESISKDKDSISNNEDFISNKDFTPNEEEFSHSRKELKFWLKKYNINPVIIFESLHEEGIKERIKLETRKKAGIYAIFNLITGDFYIGSAITNRFYSRFYRHLIKGLGNKLVHNSVNKYKLENFAFIILEVFPEEVTRKNNKDLMELETKWLKTYFPRYNLLLEAGSSFGYKHTEQTKQKMKENYSEERKLRIASINKGKPLSESRRMLISGINNPMSKKVFVYSLDPETQEIKLYKEFNTRIETTKFFNCNKGTILNYLDKNKLFKKQWLLSSSLISELK